MIVELDEDQRQEVKNALLDRRDDLEKLIKDSQKKHAPNKYAEKLLLLYADSETVDRERGSRRTIPGLLALFADEPELSTQTAAGFERTTDSDPDLFGGGSEQGGGHPAGETGILDRRGVLHPTREAVDAANAAYEAEESAEREREGGIGAEPAEGATLRLLGKGDGADEGGGTDGIPADYEIVDEGEGQGGVVAMIEQAAYTDEGRCKECHVFRGEPHDADCSIGQALRDAIAAEATERQQAELERAASAAQPSGAPPIPVDSEPITSR